MVEAEGRSVIIFQAYGTTITIARVIGMRARSLLNQVLNKAAGKLLAEATRA